MTEDMSADRDHDRLVPYLLGTLPEASRRHIDDRILSDDALFESLRAAENELVYDYALSLLDSDERAQFEARFPANTAIRQKVANARDLLTRMRGIDGRADARSSRWSLWVPLAAAAAAVLVVGWLASENARLRDRLAVSDRLAQSAVERASESERVAQEARPRAAVAAQTAPAGPADTTKPLVLSMTLQPGALRSDSRAQRIRLASNVTALQLQLSVPAPAVKYASYVVSIRTPDDVDAWSGNVSADQRLGDFVPVVVPAAALPRNDYEVVLSGRSAAGSMQELASYTFSVLR